MAAGEQRAGRPARLPQTRRSRRRWTIAAVVVASWLTLIVITGSVKAATILLVILAGLGFVVGFGLRALGITKDHPWLRRLAERPWRDGEDVLRLALRHLPEVFVITPSGTLLAPDLVDLRMNPRDLASLGERMDPALVMQSATEVYGEQVIADGARLTGHAPPQVRIFADESVPAGRYRLRQGQPVEQGLAGHDGGTRPYQERTEPVGSGMTTVAEQTRPQVPVLRLVTGNSVAQTQASGARAGRGAVELRLPEVPTISREHARFTFSGGQWWVANIGRNGLTLNGTPLEGQRPLEDGDVIRWGMKWNAPLSRVEIG